MTRQDSGSGTMTMDSPEGTPQQAGDTPAAPRDRNRIAARAYQLYEARGGGDGRDMDDWLQAERELEQPDRPSNDPKDR